MATVDFTFQSIINVISQVMFDGNTTIGGLAIMMAVSFIMMAILANVKAPLQYSLVPMFILAIIFGAMGIMDTTVSFLVVILSAVLIAATARRTIGD